MKKSIEDVDLHGKRVLLRADFNVPLQNGQITDDYRIKMTIPTINYLLDHNVKSLHIISHLGRPKGHQKEFSLEPVYQHIKQIFQNRGYKLEFRKFYEEPAQYTLFENIRFLDEETSCQNLDQFQNYVGENADILVIDAFGVVHRKGASITETKLPAYAGLLLKKELDAVKLFDKKFDLIILGGKKVDDKILLVKNCIKKCKKIYLGGGMCKPFFEGTLVEEINEIKRIAQEYSTEILLPMDFVIKKDDKYVNTDQYNSALVDIGQESITKLVDEIKGAKSVFWNGPVGIFEVDGSSKGTQAVVKALKDVETSIIGGGDTASAISKFGKIEEYTHVSTGGGSLLALIEGRKLPGIDVIEDM